METKKFIVVWLKASNATASALHSNKRFYTGFNFGRGCNLVEYKTRAAAEKRAAAYQHVTDGIVTAVPADEFDELSREFWKDSRAVLFRYTDSAKLPAFEDAQADENGVITCAVRSAASMAVCGRRFDALFSQRETPVLLIVWAKDYYNNGVYSGRPVFVVRPEELPNVRPEKLFRMLNGSDTFTDQLSGVKDWETRAEWLDAFTDEEKRAAVAIEKHLQTLAPAV